MPGYQRRPTPILWMVLLALAVAGSSCSSGSRSHYVLPRVTGRVLDQETQKPVEGARVQVLGSDPNTRSHDTPNGARLLDADPTVRTDAEGRFTLKSVQTLGLFGTYGWYSVTLSLQRTGYQSILKSFTLADSTNAPSGEPVVAAGDVLLPPIPKQK